MKVVVARYTVRRCIARRYCQDMYVYYCRSRSRRTRFSVAARDSDVKSRELRVFVGRAARIEAVITRLSRK